MEYVLRTDAEKLSCTVVEPGQPGTGTVDGTTTAPATGRHEHAGRAGRAWAVIMHGAGTGSKERHLPLARDFAAAGLPAVAFDFSGHGRSSGKLSQLSLERRFRQALGIIEAFVPESAPLMLVGFSMSGQTVADLVSRLGSRVSAICLCAPAAYGPQAWSVPFAGGFTESIRRPRSWETSTAFASYRAFTGRSVLVVPGRDEVIPAGVTAGIERALRTTSDFAKLVIDDAGHGLGQWFADRPDHRARLVALCTGRDGRTGPQDPRRGGGGQAEGGGQQEGAVQRDEAGERSDDGGSGERTEVPQSRHPGDVGTGGALVRGSTVQRTPIAGTAWKADITGRP